MRPAARGFLSHLAGYAAPYLVMATVLAVVGATTFTPGGEGVNRMEAATLQLLAFAPFLACSAVGYALAIGFVGRHHARLRLPAMFGVIAGAATFAVAAAGGVDHLARATGLSMFAALAVLGFLAGVAASALVMVAARTFPRQRRA